MNTSEIIAQNFLASLGSYSLKIDSVSQVDSDGHIEITVHAEKSLGLKSLTINVKEANSSLILQDFALSQEESILDEDEGYDDTPSPALPPEQKLVEDLF